MSGEALDRNDQFMRLFASHCEQVRAYIGSLLPQATDADDVFQQVSITLWRNFNDFAPGSNFPAWACAVSLNAVRNYRRVESRRPVFLLGDEVLESIAQLHEATYQLQPARHEALTKCLEKLPAESRELIERCYRGTQSIAEVAETLGRTANALYKRLKSIRRILFDCINRTLAAQEIAP